jgi:hypothetical protein
VQSFDIHALLLRDGDGLLLRPVTPDNTHSRGTFTRIGWFCVEFEVKSEVAVQAIKELEDPNLIYRERREDGTCLVTII